VFLA
jgi:hypothetical protein